MSSVDESMKPLQCDEELDERKQVRFIEPTDVVLEIGSHYGMMSCQLSSKVHASDDVSTHRIECARRARLSGG